MSAGGNETHYSVAVKSGGVLLKSVGCVRLNLRCTTANVAATSTAAMALCADTDDDARKALAA